MTTGAPIKSKRGIWHEEARRLRAEGWTYQQIADHFGVTNAAVYFIINPDKRAMYQNRRDAKLKDLASLPEAG